MIDDDDDDDVERRRSRALRSEDWSKKNWLCATQSVTTRTVGITKDDFHETRLQDLLVQDLNGDYEVD